MEQLTNTAVTAALWTAVAALMVVIARGLYAFGRDGLEWRRRQRLQRHNYRRLRLLAKTPAPRPVSLVRAHERSVSSSPHTAGPSVLRPVSRTARED